jgi:hypothetical protein
LVCKIVTTLPFCVEPGEKLGGHALAIHDHSFHLAVFRVLFIAGQKRGDSDVIRSLRLSDSSPKIDAGYPVAFFSRRSLAKYRDSLISCRFFASPCEDAFPSNGHARPSTA